MKLISMTDFVSQNLHTGCAASQLQILHRYKDFLKQPLTLGMFVPCDEEGRIWEAPKGCCSGRECGCMGQPVNYYSQKDIDKYYELEEKVLFKGFKHYSSNSIINSEQGLTIYLDTYQFTIEDSLGVGGGDFHVNTLEGLAHADLQIELTESALKQIGLNP